MSEQNKCNCNEWQPIESAPRDGTEILGYNSKVNKCGIISWRRYNPTLETFVPRESLNADASYYENDFDYDWGKITHWMPLPKPPQQ